MKKPIYIHLSKYVGAFAENKDVARDLRKEKMIPAIKKERAVIVDFKNVDSATQSFIHVLISELMRDYGSEVLDMMAFKNCNETIQKIIGIVVAYMQESD